jgi:tyrosine-specific transport protein
MKARDIGCILLILGTTVGAAMLALPVVTARQSYWVTICMVVGSWAAMTTGAWAIMRVNCAMPLGSNFVTMARATMGRIGYWIMWISYLMLLYALICAYLAGSSDVVQALLAGIHIYIPRFAATILTAFLLASVVYRGVASVDWANRALMLFKLVALVILMVVISPESHLGMLMVSTQSIPHFGTIMVVLCSFGFSIILPSIRVYLEGDEKRLSRVMWLGSLLPLFIYLIWIALIQGAVPRTGAAGLIALNNSTQTNSQLMNDLVYLTHSTWLHALSRVFISICALTAFLGVSMCLMDFLSDGLKKTRVGSKRIVMACLTYLPPLFIVLFDPRLFTKALAYAGALCVIILIAMPIIMYFRAREKGWIISSNSE